jgi:hypothetical protein
MTTPVSISLHRSLVGITLALGIAACGGGHAEPAHPSDPADPTLPSWAPLSCAAYHKAVVQAGACMAIEQATRDSITTKYDAANTSWHALHDAPPGTIDQIQLLCVEDAKYVRAEIGDKCVP